jgi:hypothetical protein
MLIVTIAQIIPLAKGKGNNNKLEIFFICAVLELFPFIRALSHFMILELLP